MNNHLIAVLTITLLAASPLAAQPAAPAGPKPALPTQSAQPARPLPFSNVPQVCQLREREMVSINLQLLGRSEAGAKETDQAKRAQILSPMQDLRSNLRETEASWQRMECARILYSAR